MAFQQSDLTALEAAIATGALKVRYSDGREVTYRTLAEMQRLRQLMRAELGYVESNRIVLAEHRR